MKIRVLKRFDGIIDDVMILDKALSSDEVEALYEAFDVEWEKNGNIKSNDAAEDISYTFNRDNKLRKAEWPTNNSIELKYDPLGNRVYKKSGSTERKYVIDITGELPVILMELDKADNMDIMKKYIYADRQILAQHDIDDDAQPAKDDIYFYLHDRLGSVRLVIDDEGAVVKQYTYEPFGQTLESGGSFDNAFMFTGQYFDAEIQEYYLRARQYNPHIARFTTRDPVAGSFNEPLTLHRYLYCENDPINYIDPDGKWSVVIGGSVSGNYAALITSSTKQFGIVGGAMAHNAIISLLCAEVGAGLGATFGAGAFFGYGEDGWFGGTIQWAAGGASVASGSGGSLTLDIGYSPNAQKGRDLSGGFTEYGGSITGPAPVGSPFFFGTGGFSYAIGDTGTELWTVSGGAGYSSWGWGFEGHVYRGYATVQEW